MSMHDLVVEFTMLRNQPLQMGWDYTFEQGAEERPNVYSGHLISSSESSLLSSFLSTDVSHLSFQRFGFR